LNQDPEPLPFPDGHQISVNKSDGGPFFRVLLIPFILTRPPIYAGESRATARCQRALDVDVWHLGLKRHGRAPTVPLLNFRFKASFQEGTFRGYWYFSL